MASLSVTICTGQFEKERKSKDNGFGSNSIRRNRPIKHVKFWLNNALTWSIPRQMTRWKAPNIEILANGNIILGARLFSSIKDIFLVKLCVQIFAYFPHQPSVSLIVDLRNDDNWFMWFLDFWIFPSHLRGECVCAYVEMLLGNVSSRFVCGQMCEQLEQRNAQWKH